MHVWSYRQKRITVILSLNPHILTDCVKSSSITMIDLQLPNYLGLLNNSKVNITRCNTTGVLNMTHLDVLFCFFPGLCCWGIRGSEVKLTGFWG